MKVHELIEHFVDVSDEVLDAEIVIDGKEDEPKITIKKVQLEYHVPPKEQNKKTFVVINLITK